MKKFFFLYFIFAIVLFSCSKEKITEPPNDYYFFDNYIEVSLSDTLFSSDSLHIFLYDETGYQTIKMSVKLNQILDNWSYIADIKYTTFGFSEPIHDPNAYLCIRSFEKYADDYDYIGISNGSILLINSAYKYSSDYSRIDSIFGSTVITPSDHYIFGNSSTYKIKIFY
ncbi:MAG: hypothetical protein A2W91_12710 [Bacteroidetes bacterium GWF2_38_335]|nr:MAG: hypothetical protein A2W91_12710 [Bacteroidetes bacterium GWF2_38_335]OFY77028.1 MAG: hypothetical protein A2281_00825 [Bacteroidetes bacterium RIFOXYA12_FULL_38_20]HBS86886.1 hypothetical protein [Bacteroidales bacterium]